MDWRNELRFGQVWVWQKTAICFLIARHDRPLPDSIVRWHILRLDDDRTFGHRLGGAHFESDAAGWVRLS